MKQLHPKSVWLFFSGSIIFWLAILIIVGIFFSSIFFGMGQQEGNIQFADLLRPLLVIVSLLVIAIVFSYVWARLTYHFYRYEIIGDTFKKESGVIWKKYVSIPLDRIQNIDIQRGILARMLGLSELNIRTAGSDMGRSGELLPGLLAKDAEELRDELLKKAKKSRGQGL